MCIHVIQKLLSLTAVCVSDIFAIYKCTLLKAHNIPVHSRKIIKPNIVLRAVEIKKKRYCLSL